MSNWYDKLDRSPDNSIRCFVSLSHENPLDNEKLIVANIWSRREHSNSNEVTFTNAIPTDAKELSNLASEAQRKNTERSPAAMGLKVKADMIDRSIANVLSPAFLNKTLDFRGEE
jgi:hypothetical protein